MCIAIHAVTFKILEKHTVIFDELYYYKIDNKALKYIETVVKNKVNPKKF